MVVGLGGGQQLHEGGEGVKGSVIQAVPLNLRYADKGWEQFE